MKKIIIMICLVSILLGMSACTVAPATDQTDVKNKTFSLFSPKPTATEIPPKTEIARPKKVTDKDITDTQKILVAVSQGKMKTADADKKLDKIASKVGHLGLAWIVKNLK